MKQLLFLHGAMGCAKHWHSICEHLRPEYEIHCPDFPGHGMQPSIPSDFTLSGLSNFVQQFASENGLRNYMIIGYSLGGYVGLNIALRQASGLDKVFTVATKMHWDPDIAEIEILKLNVGNLQVIAEKLSSEHGSNWQELIPQTHEILRSIGSAPLTLQQMSEIRMPVSMLRGERDKLVRAEETELFANSIPNGRFLNIPGQGHLLERMDVEELLQAIRISL